MLSWDFLLSYEDSIGEDPIKSFDLSQKINPKLYASLNTGKK
jgi:hypothetical protein